MGRIAAEWRVNAVMGRLSEIHTRAFFGRLHLSLG